MSSFDLAWRKDGVPDPTPDSILVILTFVKVAIINTVHGNGSRLDSNKTYAKHAMLEPLESIVEMMKSYMSHLDRYAYKIKLLAHREPEIARIYNETQFSDDRKYPKIFRRLRNIGPIEPFYGNIFLNLSEQLNPVVEAIETLTKLIYCISLEGNFIVPDGSSGSSLPASSGTTSIEEQESPNTSNTLNSGSNSSCASQAGALLHEEPLSFHSNPPYIQHTLSAIRSTVNRTTPGWKMLLSDLYPVESLSVTLAEMQVFGQMLEWIQKARDAVLEAKHLSESHSELAFRMHHAMASWTALYDDWASMSKEVTGSPVEAEATGYSFGSWAPETPTSPPTRISTATPEPIEMDADEL